jgi:hypothetical protein
MDISSHHQIHCAAYTANTPHTKPPVNNDAKIKYAAHVNTSPYDRPDRPVGCGATANAVDLFTRPFNIIRFPP